TSKSRARGGSKFRGEHPIAEQSDFREDNHVIRSVQVTGGLLVGDRPIFFPRCPHTFSSILSPSLQLKLAARGQKKGAIEKIAPLVVVRVPERLASFRVVLRYPYET